MSAFRSSLILFLACSGCLKTRDLGDPFDRPTSNTAYSFRGTMADVSVGGSRTEELGARVGLTQGLAHKAHVQINAGHLALGVLNVGGRVMLYEEDDIALAVNATALVGSGKWMWYLPDAYRDPIRDITFSNIPLSTTLSVRSTNFVTSSISLGYDHSEVSGTISEDSYAFDGILGARRLWVRPTVHVLVFKKLVLEGTVLVPYASWGLIDADADATVSPGVRVGVRSQEWGKLPPYSGIAWQASMEVRSGPLTYRLGASGNPILREFGVPVTPYVGIRYAPGSSHAMSAPQEQK